MNKTPNTSYTCMYMCMYDVDQDKNRKKKDFFRVQLNNVNHFERIKFSWLSGIGPYFII